GGTAAWSAHSIRWPSASKLRASRPEVHIGGWWVMGALAVAAPRSRRRATRFMSARRSKSVAFLLPFVACSNSPQIAECRKDRRGTRHARTNRIHACEGAARIRKFGYVEADG